MKISYAQNYEDILIDRLFQNQTSGFYLDVGAAHPDKDSVTKYFYKKGWKGINIEPNPIDYKRLLKSRKRDINLCCACSDQDGEVDYFFVEEDSKISFIGEPQNKEVYLGKRIKKMSIPMKKLSTVCETLKVGSIDFLKIDVEGAEIKVLQGMDLKRWKPRLIVIESVGVKSQERVDSLWLKELTENNYKPVYFDGFNSYFVQNHDEEAQHCFSLPLNVTDHFVRAEDLQFKKWLKLFVSH